MRSGLMKQVCRVQQLAPTQDASGGTISAWVDVDGLGTVRCSLQPASYRTATEFGRRDGVTVFDLYTETDISGATKRAVVVNEKRYVIDGYKPYPPGVTLTLFQTVVSIRNA